MTTYINQVTRYNVEGQDFQSLIEAEKYMLDKFGEALDGLLIKVAPDFRHKQATLNLVQGLWDERALFTNLLDVAYMHPVNEYTED